MYYQRIDAGLSRGLAEGARKWRSSDPPKVDDKEIPTVNSRILLEVLNPICVPVRELLLGRIIVGFVFALPSSDVTFLCQISALKRNIYVNCIFTIVCPILKV